MGRLRTIAALLLCGLALTAPLAIAEPSALQPRIDAAADVLRHEPRFSHLSDDRRTEMVRFVAGNMLFVLLHEIGHVLVTEMGLPVLGREEDAADAFASVAMLGMRNEFSERVLAEAARGWFMSDRRDRAEGAPLAYYDEHSLSRQRAYQIVCYMVGSDPEKFAALAMEAGMPESRRASCLGDFSNASWSWDRVLAPHRRRTDDARMAIRVRYEDGGARFGAVADAMRSIALLETVAERSSEAFAWRAPFAMQAKSCGAAHAEWNLPSRTLTVCYELAAEFGALYATYGSVLRY